MLPELAGLIVLLGFWGVTFVVFAENGLFFGFLFPGDSLLITAGLLAAQDLFSLNQLMAVLPLAAAAGAFVGYFFGKIYGPKIFNNKKSKLFNPKHIVRARNFYSKHGNKAIILARFIPIIRTFAPIVAGAAKMRFKKFAIYNTLGAYLWTCSMLMIGYFLGNSIPNVEKYILPVIILIVAVSFLPTLVRRQ